MINIPATAEFYIGDDANYSSETNSWNGKIDEFYIYNKALDSTEVSNLYNVTNSSCVVNIPDANFKNYLVNSPSINTNGDTEIQCDEASAYTGQLLLANQSITDLTGIEAFTGLTDLRCNDNLLTSLDISSNTSLTNVWSHNNQITSIDLSNNTSLVYFSGYNNQISSINLNNCTSLSEIQVSDNQLTSIDVSPCTALTYLWVGGNQLTTIDLSNNLLLDELLCGYNQLSTLDLSGNPLMNQFKCENNLLTSLNLANGNNNNWVTCNTTNNPGLSCIQIDIGYTPTTFWFKDSTANYSENCNTILISSITVQGQGGVSTITTNGGTLQMEAAILPANADDMTYTWSVVNGTGTASIDANGLLTASADGTVDVVATANDASGVTGSKTIAISNQSVGIKDIAFENLNVYPNPTTGIVNIAVGNEEITSIRIFDLAGRVVKQYGNESQINVSDITTGIYMLEIANDKKRSIVKLVVR